VYFFLITLVGALGYLLFGAVDAAKVRRLTSLLLPQHCPGS